MYRAENYIQCNCYLIVNSLTWYDVELDSNSYYVTEYLIINYNKYFIQPCVFMEIISICIDKILQCSCAIYGMIYHFYLSQISLLFQIISRNIAYQSCTVARISQHGGNNFLTHKMLELCRYLYYFINFSSSL